MIDVRYAAGFFDADGSVGILRAQRKRSAITHYALRVLVGQAHRATLDEYRQRWGGGLYWNKASNVWEWAACGNTAQKFLCDVLPHLKLKRREARLAVRFQREAVGYQRRGTLGQYLALPCKIQTRQCWYYQAMQKLRQRRK